MADTSKLFEIYTEQQVNSILNRAIKLAQENPKLNWLDIQKAFSTGYGPACIIQDWLSDEYLTQPRVSKHWIRCGKIYVLNNSNLTLFGMTERLKTGWRSAHAILLELQKKGLIRIKDDLSFVRLRPRATKSGLIKQVKSIGKKYRGRCEPELLARKMYIDIETATQLSEYGRRKLGLTRKYMERCRVVS